MGEVVVVLNHVKKQYSLQGREDVVTALEDIHVAPGSEFYPIRRGEFIMLRGPSGGGKTTLLNLLGTIDKATGGTVEILGKVVDQDSSDEYLSKLRLEKIGFVFQTFNLLATMSAYENVELPMIILGKLSMDEIKARTKELLTLVGLQDRMNHLPSELSGGEQQRVTIARALANEPEILLLDEPTGDLDTRTTIEVMDLLLSINQKRNTTCVMVSHNPDVECYADRIFYIEDGKFVNQAINTVQSKLEYAHYIHYVNSQKHTADSENE
uniref:ABC transporter domain-containing protein n=1 Tax=Arcella intermedia TaxID=1963864 RepID=A0A6B2LDM5_9EUKA